MHVLSEVRFCDDVLAVVEEVRLLGVQIDYLLKWKFHVRNRCKKLNTACYALRTVVRFLNYEAAVVVYYSNFISMLRYGIVFWGNASNLEQPFVIQKKALRVILNLSFRQSCRGFF